MRRAVVIAVLVLCAAVAGPARAAGDLERTFQDDNHLIYTDRAGLRATLDRLKGLGVDRVRVTVLWKVVAPKPGERQRPLFDAADPGSYPNGSFDRYDAVVQEAKARGMKVNFNVTGPAPLWANDPPPRADIADTYEPDPVEFGRFVRALGTRYSGTYPPSPYIAPDQKLPRVDYWTIWNEPDHSGWLTPQWHKVGKRFVERSPVLYRELVDWAFASLAVTGHQGDTILIGETKSGGVEARLAGEKRNMKPLVFIRNLYCVDRRFRFLKGRRAADLACGDDRAKFASAHPGLFSASGWSHHPYELLLPPSIGAQDRDYVNMAVLSRLTRTLDRILRAYGRSRRYKLFLTEYGYQTKPDPIAGRFVSFAKQAAWINEAEYMAWRNPRVKTMSQFLLYDDDLQIPASFQSGLLTQAGKPKPSYSAYRIPIHIVRRRGSRVTVWGRAPGPGQLEVLRGKSWRRLKAIRRAGYFRVTVRARRGARVRLTMAGRHSRVARIR